MPALKTIPNAACTQCGCLCDDIELTVEHNRIVQAKNACPRGETWFLTPRPEDRPLATIEGRPASLEDAVERAAQILTGARYPLICGLADATCEAQRIAVGIADRIGACVDASRCVGDGAALLSLQEVGEVTC